MVYRCYLNHCKADQRQMNRAKDKQKSAMDSLKMSGYSPFPHCILLERLAHKLERLRSQADNFVACSNFVPLLQPCKLHQNLAGRGFLVNT